MVDAIQSLLTHFLPEWFVEDMIEDTAQEYKAVMAFAAKLQRNQVIERPVDRVSVAHLVSASPGDGRDISGAGDLNRTPSGSL